MTTVIGDRLMRRLAPYVGMALALSAATSAVAQPTHHRPAPARSATPAPITATDCEEHEAWVDGDPATVAKALPAGYTALTDTNGAPIVFARAEHCAALATPGRAPRPVT